MDCSARGFFFWFAALLADIRVWYSASRLHIFRGDPLERQTLFLGVHFWLAFWLVCVYIRVNWRQCIFFMRTDRATCDARDFGIFRGFPIPTRGVQKYTLILMPLFVLRFIYQQ